MAQNLYRRTDVTGKTTLYTRKGTQGRKPSPSELRKVKLSARVSIKTKQKVRDQANKYNMSPSAYCDLALSLFDISIFVGQ